VVQRPANIQTSGRKFPALFSRNTLFHKHPLTGVLIPSKLNNLMLHKEALLILHSVKITSRTPAHALNYLPTVISLRLGINIHGKHPNLDIIAISAMHQDIRDQRMQRIFTATIHIHAQTVAYRRQ
jgi:hypothetical protein